MDKTLVVMEEAAAVPAKWATEAADNLPIFLFFMSFQVFCYLTAFQSVNYFSLVVGFCCLRNFAHLLTPKLKI